MQVGQWSKSKIVGAVALGLAAAVLQGWLVFVLMEWPGSFVSVTGLKCVGVPLLIEGVVAIVTLMKFDELHERATLNRQGPLSRGLLNRSAQRSEPPPVRDAWSGGFEKSGDAADKLSKGR